MIITGDVHGKFDKYFNLVKDHEYSICLGDFGFQDSWKNLEYSNLSHYKHKILGGNHDDYNYVKNSLFSLGDYGEFELENKEFFFIRGGLSLDKTYREFERIKGNVKTYWVEEELNLDEMLGCMKEYIEVKPSIVFSHSAPSEITKMICLDPGFLVKYGFDENFSDNTSRLLQNLFEIHQPLLWVFGHLHKSFNQVVNGTEFICLKELETLKL